jgi:hypothetical protein
MQKICHGMDDGDVGFLSVIIVCVTFLMGYMRGGSLAAFQLNIKVQVIRRERAE